MTKTSLGAWLQDDGVHFRVWAPKCQQVDVCIEGKDSAYVPLKRDDEGYFTGKISQLNAGALYRFCVDSTRCFPDPCSRYQPQGPHGPSQIIDDSKYVWHDQVWQSKGIAQLKGQILYEMHFGTFTQKGTYEAAKAQLPYLKELGVTVLEIMPLAEFPGRWNWGYDGVNLFAPPHVYGTPDQLKEFIDAAHQLELGVILDVVYNHFGPDGNYITQFSDDYFSKKYKNEWGEPLNFDGDNAGAVREFFIQNACYWIHDFHFDGLRFDATQSIFDASSTNIMTEIANRMRNSCAPKKIILIGENESQHVSLMKSVDQGGIGLDGLWNDDFHHSVKVALTGRREAYYTDYLGRAQEFISLVKHGFLYQGQYYSWQRKGRGTVVDQSIKSEQFIVYMQNHDQVANSLDGKRIAQLADPSLYRAMTAYFLLSPNTPMLFMGQEFGASSPFLYFTDHNPELGKLVKKGRREFLAQFPSLEASKDLLLDPQDPQVFMSSKLNFEERESHKEIYFLHMDLLKIRKEDPVFKIQDNSLIEGAVLNDHAFVLRFKGEMSNRLLIVNLGPDLNLSPCPEPLFAVCHTKPWHLLWSSEDTRYGGRGIIHAFQGMAWNIPGLSALIYSC